MRDSTWETHGHLGMSDNGKDPAPSATPGAIHRGVGYASMAEENSVCWEHERIVGKLNGRRFLRVHHHLERFNTLNYRGGGTGALAGEAAHTPNPIAIKAGAKANRVVLRI
jgi:hypothetical protein